MGLFSFLTQDIAVDLGTANTIIICNDKMVVNEPSIVAIDRKTEKVIAIGEKARQMQGKTHDNIKKAQAIISELRVTLDHKYPVWEDFDRVYDYIYRRLVEGNMSKEIDVIEDALKYIREMCDTWKEVMKKAASAK